MRDLCFVCNADLVLHTAGHGQAGRELEHLQLDPGSRVRPRRLRASPPRQRGGGGRPLKHTCACKPCTRSAFLPLLSCCGLASWLTAAAACCLPACLPALLPPCSFVVLVTGTVVYGKGDEEEVAEEIAIGLHDADVEERPAPVPTVGERAALVWRCLVRPVTVAALPGCVDAGWPPPGGVDAMVHALWGSLGPYQRQETDPLAGAT